VTINGFLLLSGNLEVRLRAGNPPLATGPRVMLFSSVLPAAILMYIYVSMTTDPLDSEDGWGLLKRSIITGGPGRVCPGNDKTH